MTPWELFVDARIFIEGVDPASVPALFNRDTNEIKYWHELTSDDLRRFFREGKAMIEVKASKIVGAELLASIKQEYPKIFAGFEQEYLNTTEIEQDRQVFVENS